VVGWRSAAGGGAAKRPPPRKAPASASPAPASARIAASARGTATASASRDPAMNTSGTKSHESELRAHYERVWGAAARSIRWSDGLLWELPPNYNVLEFEPQTEAPAARCWRYATVGMSQPEDDRRLELFIESPVKSQRVVELLNMTAHFHRSSERLGLGHTVNFGSPWLPSSKCDHGLLSLP